MLDDSALAKEELKMIIWEGYADDKYRIPFEEANDCTVRTPKPAPVTRCSPR